MDTEITPLSSDLFEYVMDFYKALDSLSVGNLNRCSEARMKYGRLKSISRMSSILPLIDQATVLVAIEHFENLLPSKLSFLTTKGKSLPPCYHVESQEDFEYRLIDRSFATVHQEVQDLSKYLDDYEVYYELTEGSPKTDEFVLEFARESISKLPFSFQLGLNVAQPLHFGKWGKELTLNCSINME